MNISKQVYALYTSRGFVCLILSFRDFERPNIFPKNFPTTFCPISLGCVSVTEVFFASLLDALRVILEDVKSCPLQVDIFARRVTFSRNMLCLIHN